MELKEAEKKLKISRATLYRYRKKLDIVEETKKEISDDQVKQIRKLLKARNIYTKTAAKKKEIIDLATLEDLEGEYMEVSEDDSREIVSLKKQYNMNLNLISAVSKHINRELVENDPPSKYLMDMLEKFQKLNMQIVTTLDKVKPAGDDLKKMIQDRMDSYL